MPETGDDPDYADRMAANADVHKSAWQATLDDMNAMRDELEEQGWSVTALGTLHTTPNPPNEGDSSRYGLIHILPDNFVDEFTEAFERGHREGSGFEEYEVYQSEAAGSIFQVTVLYDDPTETAIMLAGAYELLHAKNLMRAAVDTDEMYTHVQTLDKEILGSFRHQGWERFFPNAKQRLGRATE